MNPIPFGRFVLLERLAMGGMAELFLAKAIGPKGFEKNCVIKRVLPHLATDPRFISMFLEEARLAASLDHPSIVQIFELGEEAGDPYIAMEYLAGETAQALEARLAARGEPCPIAIATAIIERTAEALHFAHEHRSEAGERAGIVHRDVSPSNLILTYAGAVKVVDFGIARAESRLAQTHPGLVQGKPGYLAPEQVLGGAVDRRADIWALGVCLHELLTGKPLFDAERGSAATLMNVLHGDLPPPSACRPEVPPELDHWVMSCLEREPDRRLASAEALANGLRSYSARTGSKVDGAYIRDFMTEVFGAERREQRLRRAVVSAVVVTAPTDALPAPVAPKRWRFARASGLVLLALAAGVGVAATVSRARHPSVAPMTPDVLPSSLPRAVAVNEQSAPLLPAPPSVAAMARPAPPATRASTRPGFLNVVSNVPVTVSDEKRSLGQSPLLHLRLVPGSHRLRLENARLGIVRRLRTVIRSGHETDIQETFRTGEVNINVKPWADVWLDGRKLGQTPLAAKEVWEGRHRLRIASPLGEKSLSVEVKPGEVLHVEETLP